jgi:hypothetical protein
MNTYTSTAAQTNTATHEVKTQTNEVKINEAALLVTLSMGIPPMVKTDKKATKQVEDANGTDRNIGEFKKKLLTADTLDKIMSLRGEARTYHYAKTLPWGDSGVRLLPNVYLIDYQNELRRLQTEFERLTEDFLAAYPAEVAQAQLKSGCALRDLFNEADYPPTEQMKDKFKFSVSFEPLPSSGDFRVDIGATAAQELKDMYNKLTEDRIGAAMKDVWERLLIPLKNLSMKLDYEEVEDKSGTGNHTTSKPKNGHFKGTIVTNVLEIVDVMKECNLMGDPKMEQVRIDLRKALTGVTYDGLKNSESLRILTKEKIDGIIGNLGW